MKFIFKLIIIFIFFFVAVYFSLSKLANQPNGEVSNENLLKEPLAEVAVKALPKKLNYESITTLQTAMDQMTFEESNVVLHLGEYLDPDDLLDFTSSTSDVMHLGELLDPDVDFLLSVLTKPMSLGEYLDPELQYSLLTSSSKLIELGEYIDVDTFFLEISSSSKVQHLGENREPEEQ